MSRIPQRFIDDLLGRLDIVDVIDHRVKLKKTGKNYMACCPFHDEKTPSFSVNPDKQFYYCFGCGANGNAITFVMDYEHVEFPQAVESLAQTVGLEVPKEELRPGAKPATDANKPLFETLEHAAQFFEYSLRKHPESARAITYLKQRGLTGDIAKTYRLGYAPPGWDNLMKALGRDAPSIDRLKTTGMLVENDRERTYDRFRDRIVFPIADQRGRVIAFGGRVLGDDKPKYLNSPETPVFSKSRELYGLYQARKTSRSLDRIVVVEGYMDVIALAQHGITYAVATLGTATSESHLERVYRMTSEVVFCFDGDEAGRKAALRALDAALPAMQDGREARFLFLPEGEDPDSLVRDKGRDYFEHQLDTATPLEDLLFTHTADQLDTSTTQGKTRWAKATVPYLSRLPDGVYRDLMFRALADRTGIEISSLRKLQTSEKEQDRARVPEQDLEREYGDWSDMSGALTSESDEPPTLPPPDTTEPIPASEFANLGLRYAAANPVHRLIGLIALRPTIAQPLDADHCPAGSGSDIALLRALIDQVQAQPDITTAALLGYWYGTPEGEFLAELAGKELLGDDDGLQSLAQALWERLRREDPLAVARDRLTALRRHDYGALSAEQKRELLTLTAEVRQLSGKSQP